MPARVVSGWSIKPSVQEQAVAPDQAHQWAEIGLEGIGWVTFDLVPNEPDDPSGGASPGAGDADDPANDR